MHNINRLTLALVIVTGLLDTAVQALPIGFGYNQGNIEFDERTSDNFRVYHDRRVPTEGAMTLNALEGARPVLERWFEVHRKSPLPVIMSAESANASFANFVTDAIELQTLGQGNRDLAWHEYTHSTMYRTMDNWFGPAGAVLHLAWLPAWYLEGLAEAMSVSVGSDVTASIERYQALSDEWPSFDRLHSLYSKAGFFERGYATSGALVSYLLKKGNAGKLSELQHDFFRNSMPWMWPWSVVPFNGYLPMDAALRDFVSLDGEALYEAYKEDAKVQWTGYSKAPFLVKEHAPKAKKTAFSSLGGVRSANNSVYQLMRIDGDLWEVELSFDNKTGWANGYKKLFRYDSDDVFYTRIVNNKSRYSVSSYPRSVRGGASQRLVRLTGTKSVKAVPVVDGLSQVLALYETPRSLVWLDNELATTQICSVPKAGKAARDKKVCAQATTQPKRLRSLGARLDERGYAHEVWLGETEETLYGNRYQVLVVDPKTLEVKRSFPSPSEPLQAAFTGPNGSTVWLMTAERNDRALRRIDSGATNSEQAGVCLGELRFKDYLLDVQGLNDGSLVLGLYAGDVRHVIKLDGILSNESACQPATIHTSPLLIAMTHPKISLKDALSASDLWRRTPSNLSNDVVQKVASAEPLDQDIPKNVGAWNKSKPAKWRGRPIVAFPWIGADDALGLQYGLISLPLMDNLQNETVRATFLYGAASNFPYQEISLISTRFWPTFALSAYRQQTYNGRYYDADDLLRSAYYDEKGGRLEAFLSMQTLGGQMNLGTGIKYAYLKPYIGPYNIARKGNLIEPMASLSVIHQLGPVTWVNGVDGRVAPESLNDEFDYNQVGANTNLSLGLPLSSKISVGAEGSRTRGRKERHLREMYTPLKTFVPGSGGGYNKNNFPIVGGDTGGLFSPLFGDTQARAKANWTIPVIPDVDKLVGILYVERLDFTAFYNYGGAWTGDEPRLGWNKLLRAHGYNLDLQLEDKGFRFNLGMGVGQVVGQDFEVYATSGFDAIF